jgi:hypothetical protein
MTRQDDARSARQRLATRFFQDLLSDWCEHGPEILKRLRRENASDYVKTVATSVRDFRLEVHHVVDEEMAQVRTRAELFDLVRARGGERAVEALALLVGSVDGDNEPSNIITLRPNESRPSNEEDDG